MDSQEIFQLKNQLLASEQKHVESLRQFSDSLDNQLIDNAFGNFSLRIVNPIELINNQFRAWEKYAVYYNELEALYNFLICHQEAIEHMVVLRPKHKEPKIIAIYKWLCDQPGAEQIAIKYAKGAKSTDLGKREYRLRRNAEKLRNEYLMQQFNRSTLLSELEMDLIQNQYRMNLIHVRPIDDCSYGFQMDLQPLLLTMQLIKDSRDQFAKEFSDETNQAFQQKLQLIQAANELVQSIITQCNDFYREYRIYDFYYRFKSQ